MRRALGPGAAAAALVFAACAAIAGGPDGCAAPPALIALGPTLGHAADRVAETGRLNIVALGSSSTEGAGASAPAMSYPSRLEGALADRLPGIAVRVVNRGRGGEDAGEELARFSRDVLAFHPDLVIWQVGTNAVLRRDDLAGVARRLRRGVALLKQSGSDIVFMDLQYAPRVLETPAYQPMEQLIAATARRAQVGLFHRFALMRYWLRTHQLDGSRLIGVDGLHMTDASYGCLAVELAAALAANWSHADEQSSGRSCRGRDCVAGTLAAAAAPNGSPAAARKWTPLPDRSGQQHPK